MILLETGSALFDNIIFFGLIFLIIVAVFYLIYFLISLRIFRKAFIPPKEFIKGKKSSKWQKYVNEIKNNWELLDAYPKEDIYIKGYKDYLIHATIFKSNINSKKVIIFSHGWKNSGLNDFACAGMYYLEKGFNVLVVDHYAHGLSEGKYISFSSFDHLNLKYWINYVNELFNNDCLIYLHGISMGATSVCRLASVDLLNVKGIIADSGFNDASELMDYIIGRQVKFLPKIILFNIKIFCLIICKYNLNKCESKTALAHSKYPILFIHGDKDDFVPTSHSIESYNICNSDKKILILDNAIHIVGCLMHKEKYVSTVIEFIDKH